VTSERWNRKNSEMSKKPKTGLKKKEGVGGGGGAGNLSKTSTNEGRGEKLRGPKPLQFGVKKRNSELQLACKRASSSLNGNKSYLWYHCQEKEENCRRGGKVFSEREKRGLTSPAQHGRKKI